MFLGAYVSLSDFVRDNSKSIEQIFLNFLCG